MLKILSRHTLFLASFFTVFCTPVWASPGKSADFAALAGVTPVAVYFWESGRTKPRGRSVEVLSEIRRMGVREAQERLERLEEA